MNFPLFLYNFAKVYVPAAVVLAVIFGISNNIGLKKEDKRLEPYNQIVGPNRNLNPTSSSQVQKPHQVNPVIKEKVQQSAQPQYVYLFEFTSGGRMEAKSYEVKGNSIKLFIKDGYELTIAKSTIQSVKKIRL